MQISVVCQNRVYRCSAAARSIAIPMDFDGEQPNHFSVPRAHRRPVESGTFIGDTRRGGSCNVDCITLIPHCNGTHTECVGHIVNKRVTIDRVLEQSWMLAELVSVRPQPAANVDESYRPPLAPDDLVITATALQQAVRHRDHRPAALVLRTLPNLANKQSASYGDQCQPPFLTHEALHLIDALDVDHLLIDTPSIDRIFDQGQLGNHHLFWRVEAGSRQLTSHSRQQRTVTEMIFVPDDILDGLYLLNLQIAPMALDAAPSRPLLFALSSGEAAGD